MTKTFSTALKKETAVLVALTVGRQREEQTLEYLDELAFLAETLGVESQKYFMQKLERPDIRTFVGKGKLEDVRAYVVDKGIDMVIFDDDLSPSQMRNLENELKVKIYDRSLLILDIFLKRAQTAQAKTQVELARFQYLLPRLTRMWTHLERQRGGTGTRGGAGEKEIETDRRVVREKITLLRQKLKQIEKQSEVRRKSRDGIARVALVGYTNVGKSTLMQLLSKSDIFAENKLFATVDSTVRKVNFGDIPFLLSDTVGFIRKLPTHLIESFKSTLDEIREADILMHVIDISHPSYENHMEVVKTTLTDIGVKDKPTIYVFNKIDQLKDEEPDVLHENGLSVSQKLEQLKATYMARGNEYSVFISAVNKENIEELRHILFQEVKKIHMRIYPNYLQNETY
ncbi:GTPase HflX [Cytophagales bacterium LB-30]|uniref:GTPase HflX n=1 Tax=Shiella aurantiaca TaxID=3058365 RepID=A0ABT8F9A0_9BACT|nr:GTPase HflX [Shiella aurantiaca]MDN4166824.1 GTPase HflX [Shiella aurantiaca]